MPDLSLVSTSPFDSIRRVADDGGEYWMARELMPLLGYQKYERFEDAIDRAKVACRNSGNIDTEHFFPAPGSYKGKPRNDWKLSRFGSYLVAMNGDPRKVEIAAAQSYFATKTREAELVKPQLLSELEALQIAVGKLVEQERQMKALTQAQQEAEVRLQAIEAEQDRYQSPSGKMYSVLAFAKIKKIQLSGTRAAGIGARIAAVCRKRGIEIEKVYDPRFGEVNIYPESILAEIFEAVVVL